MHGSFSERKELSPSYISTLRSVTFRLCVFIFRNGMDFEIELNNMQAQSKNSSVKSKALPEAKISDIFTKTDIHGLPDWYQAKEKISKTTWTVILVLAVGFMTYELIQITLDFKNNPILTTYSVVAEPEGLEFPEIYICPVTPIHEGQRERMNIKKGWEEAHDVTEFFRPSLPSSSGGLNKILTEKTRVWEEIGGFIQPPIPTDHSWFRFSGRPPPAFTPKDIQDYFMNVGYPGETLFQECSFGSHLLNCSSIIQAYFDREYGKCFLLQVRSRQRLPGVGLSLVLNLDLEQATKNSEFVPLFDGAILNIQHKHDPTSHRKILLRPGQNIHLSLEATKMNLIQRERPHGGAQKCVGSKIGRDNLNVLYADYTLGVCHADCVQTLVLEKCHCILALDTRFIKPNVLAKTLKKQTDPFCSVTKKKECADVVIRKYGQDFGSSLKTCIRNCRFPCDIWEYRTEMSAMDFPSKVFLEANFNTPPLKTVEEAIEPSEDPLLSVKLFWNESQEQMMEISAFFNNSGIFQEQWMKIVRFLETIATRRRPRKIYARNFNILKLVDDMGKALQAAVGKNVTRNMKRTFDQAKMFISNVFGNYAAKRDYAKENEMKAQLLRSWNTIRNWQKNYIVLDIAFSTLQYLEITQEPSMTIDTFVSNLGGQVGLWIGASMVTLVKFFVILWPICLFKFRSAFSRAMNRKQI